MAIEILSSQIILQAFHTMRKVRFAWQTLSGARREAAHEVLERRDASAILLHLTDTDRLVFVRQYRVAATLNGLEGKLLEVAAGLIDGDETPLEAAIREAEEETGYRVADARHVFTIFPSPAVVTERIHLFAASVDSGDRPGSGGGVESESEETEVVEMDVGEAREMLRRGGIEDAKTAILLQWFLAERDALARLAA